MAIRHPQGCGALHWRVCRRRGWPLVKPPSRDAGLREQRRPLHAALHGSAGHRGAAPRAVVSLAREKNGGVLSAPGPPPPAPRRAGPRRAGPRPGPRRSSRPRDDVPALLLTQAAPELLLRGLGALVGAAPPFAGIRQILIFLAVFLPRLFLLPVKEWKRVSTDEIDPESSSTETTGDANSAPFCVSPCVVRCARRSGSRSRRRFWSRCAPVIHHAAEAARRTASARNTDVQSGAKRSAQPRRIPIGTVLAVLAHRRVPIKSNRFLYR